MRIFCYLVRIFSSKTQIEKFCESPPVSDQSEVSGLPARCFYVYFLSWISMCFGRSKSISAVKSRASD